MTEPSRETGALPMPRVSRKPKRALAWVWLIPLIAALIGVSIVWNTVSKQGPKISIVFLNASGLEVGKTQIKYRDVVIGTVKGIHLTAKRDSVVVEAELTKDAAGLAHSGTKFWVVKPRVGLGGVSGLSTLFSGVYIETDTTDATTGKANKYDFIGLENPPPISSDRPGTTFSLRTTNLGSLGAGSPVYYRRIQAGMVTNFNLDAGGKFIDMDVFIDAPYDKYVNASTRFWNESGIDISVGANGVDINTQSLVSLLAGGMSFASLGKDRGPLPKDMVFKLYDTQKAAELEPQGIAVPITMQFYQPTRGLKPGASVEFQGIDIGIVNNVTLEFEPYKKKFYTQVEATLYPERLGSVFTSGRDYNQTPMDVADALARLANRGLRAQLRSANLLTGQLYIAMADFPQAPKLDRLKVEVPFAVPTIPADDLGKIQQQLSNIMAKLDKIPFDQIGFELNDALKQVKLLSADLNATVTPKLSSSLVQIEASFKSLDALIAPGSQMPASVDLALDDLRRSLKSLRTLTDAVQAQPNSLILGTKSQPYSRDTLGATAK